MATLKGQVNGVDISGAIYQQIMSIPGGGGGPRGHRASSAKSANTQVTFIVTPRNSARSKASRCSDQTEDTDFDIVKSRSWSGSKLKSAGYVKTPAQGQGRSDIPLRLRSASAASSPRGAGPLPLTQRSATVLSPRPAPAATSGLQASRRGFAAHTPGLSVGESPASHRSAQVARLQEEWAAIEHCRAMKRASEMVQHRLDPMFRMSGSNVPLQERYHITDVELQKLREMAETSRMLQHDLKRIKFPGKKKDKSKSRGRSQQRAAEAEAAAAREGDDDGEERADVGHSDPKDGNEDNPAADPPPHHASPVSTPEVTPRQQRAVTEGGVMFTPQVAVTPTPQQGVMITQQGELTPDEDMEIEEVTAANSAGPEDTGVHGDEEGGVAEDENT